MPQITIGKKGGIGTCTLVAVEGVVFLSYKSKSGTLLAGEGGIEEKICNLARNERNRTIY